MDWSPVFLQAPVHDLGHFLDRKDFAALQTTSARMQESVRNVLRARNEELPAGKRMGNLGGEFCVCTAHKELLRREGCQPGDIIATGGRDRNPIYGHESSPTVVSLDLVTKQCTTLVPMITAREAHATAALGRKLFVMGAGIMMIVYPAWSAWTWRQGRGRLWLP